jgi:hypothetical protein
VTYVIASHGVLIDSPGHGTCFYKCNRVCKFYDNGRIIDYNWKQLFEMLDDLKEQSIDYKLYIRVNGPVCVYKIGNSIVVYQYNNKKFEISQLYGIDVINSWLPITGFELVSDNLFELREFKYNNSGYSFGVIMREMQIIAQNGEKEYIKHTILSKRCRDVS